MRLGLTFFLLPLTPAVTSLSLTFKSFTEMHFKSMQSILKKWIGLIIKVLALKGSHISSHSWLLNQHIQGFHLPTKMFLQTCIAKFYFSMLSEGVKIYLFQWHNYEIRLSTCQYKSMGFNLHSKYYNENIL